MRPDIEPSSGRGRRAAAAVFTMLLLAGAAGGTLAGCAGSTGVSASATSPASGGMATMTPPASDSPVGMPNGQGLGDSTQLPTPEQISAAWSARPAFVRQGDPQVQEAYAFAVARPDVVEWMPCYCGCAGLDHRSNLECFLKHREAGGAIAFEEHASYCDICVKTALMAKQMLGQGATLAQMRAAVDGAFGGNGVDGTPTELPPG
jgi:hypothetical protein